MTLTYVEGNILDIKSGIICHQVNHKGVMGAGLAKQISQKYPAIMIDYSRICKTISYPEVVHNGAVYFYDVPRTSLIVASIFGQEYYGTNGNYTDYYSLKIGISTVAKKATKEFKNVYFPYGIGCGLAGGNWDIVERLLSSAFDFAYPNVHAYVIKLPS